MSTLPHSPQLCSSSHSGLRYLPFQPATPHAPPRDFQLEGGDTPPGDAHPHDQAQSSPLEVNHSLTTDLRTLINLAALLRPFLPPGYRWFGQEDLEVIEPCAIDAGGFADVWISKIGDRKVALKSYRCYASADNMPTYNASRPHRRAHYAH